MIAEDSQTPRPRPGAGGRDALAERRALRAVDAPEAALARRAQAAEATVRALETRRASLQRRLLDAERAARHSGERLRQRELELRRADQLQFAERQLRIDAEQGLRDAERALHEADRRFPAGDRQAQLVAALQRRIAELGLRCAELARALEAERGRRRRTERMLEEMRRSHAAVARLLGEVRALAGRLRAPAEREPAAVVEPAVARPSVAPAGTQPSAAPRPAPSPEPGGALSSEGRPQELADALALAIARLRARPEHAAGASRIKPHKHSRSLIGRWRAARKHRREDR